MLGLRLDPETEASLARLARRQKRTKSDVVRDALREFLDRADADQALIAEVKAIAVLTDESELAELDAINDDAVELIEAEEAAIAAGRAA